MSIIKYIGVVIGLVVWLSLGSAHAGGTQIGEVTSAWKLLGANHTIVVERFEDPKVKGVVCYISRAKKGGIAGSMGLATDPSDASVTCNQVGAISVVSALPKQEPVFSESTSILFKKMQVVRMVDAATNTLVYLVYSDKLIDGSPKNSVTSISVDKSIKLN